MCCQCVVAAQTVSAQVASKAYHQAMRHELEEEVAIVVMIYLVEATCALEAATLWRQAFQEEGEVRRLA